MSRVCDLTNKGVQAGHSVSNSNIKTKKRFLPNIKSIKFKSDALNINLNFRLAAKTIRTINKYGNLDSFLINYGYNKLSEKGRKLKKVVQKKLLEHNELDNIRIVNGSNRKVVNK
jgi:large subunit ribosomal protein L28